MYRIRFHGRGGQGIKTASRMLGNAFFLEGFQVQDAPRYGAERRGAPIFAYVRAAPEPINERGIISRPDLIVVADDTLVGVPAAGVTTGINKHTKLVIRSCESQETWQQRLNIDNDIYLLSDGSPEACGTDSAYIGAACAGAAARLVGVISRESLERALTQELVEFPPEIVADNLETALAAFDAMGDAAGVVEPQAEPSADDYHAPDWIDLPFDDARLSAPVIHAGATSVEVRTGLWRTLRPIIDYDRCHRCWWVCSTFCPDSAIKVTDASPEIDYDHCKGCMICVAQCPSHAIEVVPESDAEMQGDVP